MDGRAESGDGLVPLRRLWLRRLDHVILGLEGDMKRRVLAVDDDAESCAMLVEGLGHRGFDVVTRTSAEAALALLDVDDEFDVVLTDLRMPGVGGLALCRTLRDAKPALPVIVVTAFGSIDTAVEAVRLGAYDFLQKPFDLSVIALALERAASLRDLRREIDRLRKREASTNGGGGLVGESPAMRRVVELVERVGPTDSTVLVTGESGTGKELVARALHDRSHRARGSFIAVNCGAIPEALFESELFGHSKGAFTDARSSRAGLVSEANGGTLFLDEIGDMPLAMQVKLLRVLQERRVRPVGSDRDSEVDVRILAATHQDLEALVAEGRFRQDLYYRLNVIEVAVPPLRVRGHDVLVLASRFVERVAARMGRPAPRLSSDVAERLLSYDWPGNVRELENCMERAVALCRGDEIVVADLPERFLEVAPRRVIIDAASPDELVSLEEVERRYILRVLDAVHGNKKLAAEVLGLDRSTLYRKLERFGRGGKS